MIDVYVMKGFSQLIYNSQLKENFSSLKILRAQPCGQVVKVPCALLQWPGFTGSDPGHGPTPLISHAVEVSHIQNRGRLAQMLVQG